MSTLALKHNHNYKNFFIPALLIIVIAIVISFSSYESSNTINIPSSYVLEQTMNKNLRCTYYDCYYIKVPGYEYCSKHLKRKYQLNRKK